MIRTDWATPPDGDFARYVDQLMARAAQARLRASHTAVDGFDGASHGSVIDPTGASAQHAAVGWAPGQEGTRPRAALADMVVLGLRRWASSPPDGKGWGRWLQERARAAATPPRPLNATARQHDPRIDKSPRKP